MLLAKAYPARDTIQSETQLLPDFFLCASAPLREIKIMWFIYLKSEGAKVLVTLLPDDEADFWLKTSQSLDAVWDNTEDDVYAQLLEK
uniref:hypothetical protein n=1 Tax=Hassallia byssoidea TaxID=482630 RepID=UPI000585892F|nr:hypothetical protein [Hassalia byssoidea]